MALYTGKGDEGTTKIFTSQDDERLEKDALIFEALGTVDELNAIIGWCRSECAVDWMVGKTLMSVILLGIQQTLFIIQAELAGAAKSITKKKVIQIEKHIATIESDIPEITSFLIPGGNELSSRLDMARTVSRRAERRVVQLHNEGNEIATPTRIYMNRLSSLLYALVRWVNHNAGINEQSPEYDE